MSNMWIEDAWRDPTAMRQMQEYIEKEVQRRMHREIEPYKKIMHQEIDMVTAKPYKKAMDALRSIAPDHLTGTYDPSQMSTKSVEKLAQDLKEAAEWQAALGEIATWLQAQDGLDMFKHNPKAKALFRELVAAGIDHIMKGKHKETTK